MFRAQYEVRKRTGLLKRKFQSVLWSEIDIGTLIEPGISCNERHFAEAQQSNGRHFFFKAQSLDGRNSLYKDKIIAQAEEILQHRFRYFFHASYDLGTPPDWFLNPITGERAESTKHWCDVEVFNPVVGDIKFVWEPSRFAWVYTLVRAYVATRDVKYAEKFWELLGFWIEANPPNIGANYVCGQECAIRLMAMCFAYYALSRAEPSSPEKLAKLVVAIAVHADRIEKNISFAVSTRTNHSLSEAAGIYTAGILFPELQGAKRWMRLGKKILIREVPKQIYKDGSYIQHSMNYHRLMLQDLLWVMRIAQLNSDSLYESLSSYVLKAVEFLYQMQDINTGRVPNYGNNDGALIIPLNTCDYLDYRPILQASYYLLTRQRLYDHGPWDEDMLWFFGPEALEAPIKVKPRQDAAYPEGGYYTLRGESTFLLMRCHSYKDRPAQADMLHLDLWHEGINILRDSGTFMYSGPDSILRYFSSTRAHNSLVVDSQDQMERISRFMWIKWTKSKFLRYKNIDDGSCKIIEAEHYGYCRSSQDVVHRRAILLFEPAIVVVDDLFGRGFHDLSLYWHLCQADIQQNDTMLSLKTEKKLVNLAVVHNIRQLASELICGDEVKGGWQSLYYGHRSEFPSFICKGKASLPARFVTILSLGETIENPELIKASTVSWMSDKKYTLELNPVTAPSANTYVSLQVGSKTVQFN